MGISQRDLCRLDAKSGTDEDDCNELVKEKWVLFYLVKIYYSNANKWLPFHFESLSKEH